MTTLCSTITATLLATVEGCMSVIANQPLPFWSIGQPSAISVCLDFVDIKGSVFRVITIIVTCITSLWTNEPRLVITTQAVLPRGGSFSKPLAGVWAANASDIIDVKCLGSRVITVNSRKKSCACNCWFNREVCRRLICW